jgi:DNA (cytosine-5)-methyltransferase 1
VKLKVLDLFSGIGGFSLGLERTGGFETVAFCEIEKYPQKVLNKHWPDVPIYEDVRNVTAERLRADGIVPDIITGGFPCQDISVAGNQAGIGEGTRSGLWSECARLLGDIRPRYAIFENVTALLSGDNGRWFEQVLWDISKVGYDAEWHCIPASELGAHHHRDRVWIICYPNDSGDRTPRGRDNGNREKIEQKWEKQSQFKSGRPSETEDLAHSNSAHGERGLSSRVGKEHTNTHSRSSSRYASQDVAHTKRSRQQGQGEYVKPKFAEAIKNWQTINAESGCISEIWAVESELGRVANGIPDRTHRLKGLGNAVVPQIPELIGMAILEAEKCN